MKFRWWLVRWGRSRRVRGFLASTIITPFFLAKAPGADFSRPQVLYQFGLNAANPRAGLAQGNDGDLYGVTMFGGTMGDNGTVFKITPNGVFTLLFSFAGTNGSRPLATLVLGRDGNFYGTTVAGGRTNDFGTVFKITPQGQLTSLFQFNGANGNGPVGALVQGSDSLFYGTTEFGGASDKGTIFRISSNGVFTSLFSFPSNGRSGVGPTGNLIQNTDGNFYGTTSAGGSTSDFGTVFRITPSGTFTSLFSFSGANGSGPAGGLARGSDGNFYGTTQFGGLRDNGSVFRITPAGVLTSLYSFGGPDGNFPVAGLTFRTDGNFYGATSGDRSFGGTNTYGTVFQIGLSGSFRTLGFFSGPNGGTPLAPLLNASDGNLYGTTFEQGSAGSGTIFRLADRPRIISTTVVGTDIRLTWNSFARGTYRVEYNPAVAGASWTALTPDVTATGTTTSFTNRVGVADLRRLYRVRLLP